MHRVVRVSGVSRSESGQTVNKQVHVDYWLDYLFSRSTVKLFLSTLIRQVDDDCF